MRRPNAGAQSWDGQRRPVSSAGHNKSPGVCGRYWCYLATVPRVVRHVEPDPLRLVAAASSWVFRVLTFS